MSARWKVEKWSPVEVPGGMVHGAIGIMLLLKGEDHEFEMSILGPCVEQESGC